MSKTRRKTSSELEHLRGYCRELEKTVRSLQKQARQYEKWDRSQDEEIARDSEDTYPDLPIKRSCACEACGKGRVIETLDLGIKGCYGECICGYKGKIV